MDKLRCGVIGTGGMGMGHVNILPNLEEVELTAVCDISPGAAQAAADKGGVPRFEKAEDLLDSGRVDMVIIATPHYFHPTIAIEAFKRGIHVLSEKPITVTVSQADAMIRAAKESGKQFGVMYQMRSAKRNQAARRLIEEGRLGEIYRTSLVMGWFRSQAYYDSGTWRATWTGEGGGVLINQAPHFLDLFTWLGGLPATISGDVRTRLHNIEVEDEAYALLEYPNGATGYLYASTMEMPSTERIEICGDKGKLLLDGSSLRFWEVEPGIREFSQDNESMWGSPKVQEIPVEYEKSGGGHGDITRNFARSILYGEPLIAPGEEGLNAVEMINGMILSGKRNKPVSVPVDRAEYDALLEELKASSQEKSRVAEQRVTDPKFG
jgi:predicted dehydrogenase